MTENILSKNRNTAKKAREKNERRAAKRRSRITVIAVVCGLVILFGILAVFSEIPSKVKFVSDNGRYIDPSNGLSYIPADVSAYEIISELHEDDLYGLMNGDEVYVVPGAPSPKWLVRALTEELYEVYYEENELLPDLEAFKPKALYLYEDSKIIFDRQEVTDKDKLSLIVEIFKNGERVGTPDGIEASYNIRFVSERYSWLYFCARYVVTENGSYFFDHLTSGYINADGILDSHVDALIGNNNE